MDKAGGDWPLVAFTGLAPITVGGAAGLLFRPGTPGLGVDRAAAVVLAVALIALSASALHLGRPLGAYRAVARPSSSWLSREVILFGAFAILLAVYTAPIFRASPAQRALLGILAVVAGGLGVWATGRVYRLPSRPAWDRWPTNASLGLGALGAGLLFSRFATALSGSPEAGPAAVAALAAVSLLLGAGLTCLRARRPATGCPEALTAWRIVTRSRGLLALRVTGALFALCLLGTPGTLSVLCWMPAAVGELADRALFFRIGVPVSMERRAGALSFDPVAADAVTTTPPPSQA